MLNEVGCKIKLIRSKDAFWLTATGDQTYKLRITGAVLLIRKVKISPSVYLAHAKALENGMARYPLRRVVCNRSQYRPVFWIFRKKNYSAVKFRLD
jgi:hypothetical protein